MKRSKWADFAFTVAVRLVCGGVLGALVGVVVGSRGILGAFSHNHLWGVGVWVALCGVIGAAICAFTIPHWQRPRYKGISTPAAWRGLEPGITRQELVAKLGEPSDSTASGEDAWRKGGWEVVVNYDAAGRATTFLRRFVAE